MRFLTLDGNSILNRAFYGIRMLSNKKGQMTNGIYGFISTMQKLLAEINPDAVGIAFDLPDPTFRHKMYESYKATRKKMPEELASQVPILKELLGALGYKTIMCKGYEADDILGTIARYCEENGHECVIATGDRDNFQLISPNVTVRLATTKFGKAEAEFYDEEKIKEIYGVNPTALIDIKALQGDASDNIPGVRGIGKKTAEQLISQFGSIKNIYENIEQLTDIKKNVREKLIDGKKDAVMSYELGKINKNVPIDIDINDYIPRPADKFSAKKLLTNLEFFSLMEKLGLNKEGEESEKIDLVNCNNFTEKLDDILNEKSIFFTVRYAKNHDIEKIYLYHSNKVYIIDSEDTIERFLKFLEISESEKVTYNIKELYKKLQNLKINFNGKKFDIMLALYLLNPSSKDYVVERCAEEYEICSPAINTCCKADEKDILYAKEVFLIKKLLPVLNRELETRCQTSLLFDIEQPLAEVLASMENEGVFVDTKGLAECSNMLDKYLENLKELIYSVSGYEFNINSPKQLGVFLFEKLNLPKGKKNKGGYSTSAEYLEEIRHYNSVINLILEYRMFSKFKSTYCDALIRLAQSDGRVHTSFNQTETRTGRISSTEPNLQNIPYRTETGRKLRKFLKAKPGSLLVDADYSQIELRILAHISQDPVMIQAFKTNQDIHSITASQIFNVPINMVTSQMRLRAKTVNFGIIYGMGAFSLAKDLGIGKYEAQNYISRYLNHYQGVKKYMENAINIAKKQGYTETMLLRRRYLPELQSKGRTLQAFGERVARNMPIQGSAADIIKIAMLNIYNRLKKENMQSKLILQVHDELIIEAPECEVSKAEKILKEEMENAVKISVPLDVHVSVGESWYDAKG